MKLKYYLRGLGTGIAVTALILGISSIVSHKEVMTDEEVISRAKELGMVERTVLSEAVSESDDREEEGESEGQIAEAESEPSESESVESVSEEPVESVSAESEAEESEPETEENVPVESEELESEAQSEPIEGESVEENITADAEFGMPDEAGTIQISIFKGDSSLSVSKRLEEAGLIDSAVDYDRYLCQNGYDKKIRSGYYEIAVNASLEEIAIMITSH